MILIRFRSPAIASRVTAAGIYFFLPAENPDEPMDFAGDVLPSADAGAVFGCLSCFGFRISLLLRF